MGACIIGTIGVVVHSNILIGCAVVLLILSCIRSRHSAPTNYAEKFGPPDPSGTPKEDNVTPFTELSTQEDQTPNN